MRFFILFTLIFNLSLKVFAFDYFQGMMDSMSGRLTTNSIIYNSINEDSSSGGWHSCHCDTSDRPLSDAAWARIKAKEEKTKKDVEEFKKSKLGIILLKGKPNE